MKISDRSLNALLSRGIDTITAGELINKGLIISKLIKKTTKELKELGLSDKYITKINSESRPPIPIVIVNKLLYESKSVCCVCREKNRGIIIHHIEEWHVSKDHSEGNLVVLCLLHHDLAHTKKGLTYNLKKENLIDFKKKWIDSVKNTDAKTIFNLTLCDNGRWDYFNHRRIFELFLNLENSDFDSKTKYTLEHMGLINSLGTFSIDDKKQSQIYNFGNGYLLCSYMSDLFALVLKNLPIIDLTDKFTKTKVLSLIDIGNYIAIQAGFYFKDLFPQINSGKGQFRLGYYQKNKLRIEFQFDAYETTCNSSWAVHLSGHRTATCIGKVTSIIEENSFTIITISCLGLGCYFDEHEFRKK